MNEDELRAFLDSATVGDDPVEDDAASAETDPLNLPPTEPILTLPAAPVSARGESGAGGAGSPDANPSFDSILGLDGEPDAAPPVQQRQPEITPIVLPAPPASAQAARKRRSTAPSAPRTAPLPTQTVPEPVVLPSAAAAAPQESGASAAQLAADLGFDVESPAGEYERIAVTGAEKEHRRLLPWIIVAAVAIVAIVASVFIVQTFRGGGETPPPVVQPTTETPSTTEPTEPTAPEEEPSDPETPETGDAAPEVEVGSTYRMPITQWDVTVEVSNKLGSVYYMLDGERMILQDGALLPKFPSSCSEMREGFGLTRLADGTFEVLRPAERCAEATELYDEVWGLVAAMIPTIEAA